MYKTILYITMIKTSNNIPVNMVTMVLRFIVLISAISVKNQAKNMAGQLFPGPSKSAGISSALL
jgi:hypothetical protein